jgi:HEAT repeat protein
MDERFANDNPVDARPLIASRGLRLLIASLAITFPLAFCLLLKPVGARAAWGEFSHLIQLRARPVGAAANPQEVSDARLAVLRPQQQAEVLLEAAIDHSPEATEQILKHASSWRGRLAPTAQLSGLLNTALNSGDMQVRAAAIESELAANNLAKNSRDADTLIARIERDPPARPWGLWMVGALGNRGVESERALAVLITYTRDPNEKTRYWAVEGLSLLGSDQSIRPLLGALHDDSSPEIRERAACGLAQSGMLTKRQRMTAVPALVDYASDSSLDAGTHALVYHALRDITGANVDNDPSAWRNYSTETASR